MHRPPLHSWDLSFAEATQKQRELASQVICQTTFDTKCRLIGGLDISYNRQSPTLYAAAIVWDRSERRVVESASAVLNATFPYVPGFLSFREAPALLGVIERLQSQPDVYLIDGNGLAHPRRFGIACHLGVWLDMPAIGCAKTRLIGTFEDVPASKGASVPLLDDSEVLGSVVRTRANIKPVFVSIGHRVSLADAVGLVLDCCEGYRVAEPIRQAHKLVNQLRMQVSSE